MISGALPVHNEAKFLPFCLHSLERANLDELCIYLDRCSDNSHKIILNWVKDKPLPFPVKIHVENRKCSWSNVRSHAFQKAYEMCEGDIIYGLGGDACYDPLIFDSKFFDDFDMVSFYYKNYDLDTPTVYTVYVWFLEKLRGVKHHLYPYRRGVYGITRKAFLKIGGFHDVGTLDGVYVEEYDIMERVEHAGFKFTLVPSKTLHLRPDPNDYKRGMSRAKIGMSLLQTLEHSVLFFKPKTFVGHLHFRRAKHE